MNSFSTALTNIRRSPYQSLAAVALLSLTFFVAYVFSFVMAGSEVVLRYFETQPQVIAFFELDTEASVVNEVATDLQNEAFVNEVTVVLPEDALEIYQEQNQDEPLLLELVTADILPASIEASGFSIADLQQIRSYLEEIETIDEIILQQDVIDTLNSWTQRLRIIGLASMAILATLSLLVLVMIISMKVVVRRPAINIMRIIGATKAYIQSPFVIEGSLYGVISALVAWCLSYGLLLYSSGWIQDFLGTISLFPISIEFLAFQAGAGLIAGCLFGAFAGILAVSRIIKR